MLFVFLEASLYDRLANTFLLGEQILAGNFLALFSHLTASLTQHQNLYSTRRHHPHSA